MKKFLVKFATILILTLAIFAGAASADVNVTATKFVTPTGAGDKGGSSWTNAMGAAELVTFLDAHDGKNGVEIWVAKGTYSPGATPESTFNLKKGVQLFGGFAGTETNRGQRDWKKNETILSGGTGGGGKQIYNIVSCIGVEDPAASPTNADTRIDGFTIKDGYAFAEQGTSDHANGGAMVIRDASPTIENCYIANNKATLGGGALDIVNSSPILKNCTFKNNGIDGRASDMMGTVIRYYHGTDGILTIEGCTFTENPPTIRTGAISAQSLGEGKLKVSNSIFSKNEGGRTGGAIYLLKIKFDIDNSVFTANTAALGGAVFADQSEGRITNCTFSGNTAQLGGALGTKSALPIIVNCTFAENSGRTGGALGLSCGPETTSVITNSIFWGNKASESGNAIHIAHEDPDPNQEYTTIALTNNVVKPADVFVKPWGYNYVTVISRDLVAADPLITSRDINGKIATKAEDVYIYELAANSSAINKGLAVGKNTITFLNGETREITVPAFDQIRAVRPNPAKKTQNADIGSDEYYAGNGDDPVKPKSSSGCTAAPFSLLLIVPALFIKKRK